MATVQKFFLFIAFLLLYFFGLPSNCESCCIIKSMRLGGPETLLIVANEKNFFSQYNLKQDFQYDTAINIFNQIKNNEETVALVPSSLAMQRIMEGDAIVAFAVIFGNWDLSIWAQKSIISLNELTTKKIIVSPGLSFTKLAVYEAFSTINRIPVTNQLLEISQPEKFPAIISGSADAIVIPLYFASVVRRFDLREIINLSTLGVNIPHSVLVTSENYFSKQPSTLKNLIRALNEAALFSMKEEKATKEIISKSFDNMDEETINLFYDVYIEKGIVPKLQPTKEMWDRITDLAKKAGFFPEISSNRFFNKERLQVLFE